MVSIFKQVLLLLLKVLYSFKWHGVELLKIPERTVLIVSHISWIDALFFLPFLNDKWLVILPPSYEKKNFLRKLISLLVRTDSADLYFQPDTSILDSLLGRKDNLFVFTENMPSPSGETTRVAQGIEMLIQKVERSRVLFGYLYGGRYLRFVRHKGATRFFYPVSLFLEECKSLSSKRSFTESVHEKDKKVEREISITSDWLLGEIHRFQLFIHLQYGPQTIPEAVKVHYSLFKNKFIWEDYTFGKLSYRRFLVGALLLADVLEKRKLCVAESNHVGVLLPSVNAAPITLFALWALGKTPTILNFTAGVWNMQEHIKLSQIKQVLTSRKFLKQIQFDQEKIIQIGVTLIFLEDLISQISRKEMVLKFIFSPYFRTPQISSDSTAVILFTSGSEGKAKGVELTHRNLIANCEQVLPYVGVSDSESIFNALPIFHGFGLSLGIIIPMIRGVRCFNYPSPLHYRLIPNLIYNQQCTIFATTNTFLSGYAKYAQKGDFESIKLLIAGGEKLQTSVYKLYAEKFSMLIYEGYGVTECAPILSVNTSAYYKLGSVGRALPGIEARIEKVPGIKRGGRLLVKGPNIMKGYLNKAENEEFIAQGGWYDTGDIAELDSNGFIVLLGRVKRFAKIGAEMVSLTMVEDILKEELQKYGDEFEIAVSSIDNEVKGEMLVAAVNEPRVELKEMREIIQRKGLSNLYIPKKLIVLDKLPRLGSGKIDYAGLKEQLQIGDKSKEVV